MDWKSLYQHLHSESDELRELDQDEFRKLQAILAVPPPLDVKLAQRDRAAFLRSQEQFDWLKRLLKFNEYARQDAASQSTGKVVPPTGEKPIPTTTEEAEDLGYVAATDLLTVLHYRFSGQANLTRLLERQRHIRTFKPHTNRKMVHAGDLIRHLASESDRDFEGLDQDGVQKHLQKKKEERSQLRK
jgi:hypothetical protein